MRYLLMFVLAVAAEVTSLVWAGRWFGGWTFVALIASFGLGVVVLSGRGLAIARQAVDALAGGQSPTAAIVDGALLVFAGVLLIIPGFASDAVALLLLVPPVRGLCRDRLIARGKAAMRAHGVVEVGHPGGPDDVIDVDGVEVRPPGPAGRRLIDG